MGLIVVILVVLLMQPTAVSAHGGPPIIVFPEQAVGPYTVTIWTDPDVGNRTLLIEVKLDNQPPPPDTSVIVQTQPKDDHSVAQVQRADRRDTTELGLFFNSVQFDAEGTWSIRVALAGSAGRAETAFELQVVAPPSNPLEWICALLPFAGIGLIWVVRMRAIGNRRRSEWSDIHDRHSST